MQAARLFLLRKSRVGCESWDRKNVVSGSVTGRTNDRNSSLLLKQMCFAQKATKTVCVMQGPFTSEDLKSMAMQDFSTRLLIFKQKFKTTLTTCVI